LIVISFFGVGRSSNSPIPHSTVEAWTGTRHRRALNLTCGEQLWQDSGSNA
jgi:hypothetical protein